MSIPFHLQYWASNFDPVIWMRVARVILFVIAGIFMTFEPFQCGGRNKLFHRLLGGFFFTSAAYQVVIARNRMILLQNNNASQVSGFDIFIIELIMTIILIMVCLKLGYDFSLYREMKRQDRNTKYCNNECEERGLPNALVGR